MTIGDDWRYCPRCAAGLEPRIRHGTARPTCPSCGFVFFASMGVGVATVIHGAAGRVLLVQRAEGQFGAGLWCLPCGYVEWGEDLRDAAAREALEEAGIAVELSDVMQVAVNRHDPDRPTVGIWFSARLLDPHAEPRAGDDAVAVGWFDPATPPPLAFPTDRPVLAELAARHALSISDPPVRHCGEGGRPMIKGLRGATIWSENLDNLLPFYRDVLGLPVGLQIPGFVVLGELGTPSLALGTHSEVHGRNTDPARHMVGLGTDDVDTDWKRLKAAGVEFVENPTDYGTLRIATLKDPEGNLLQLLQPLAPTEHEIVIRRVFDAPRNLVFKAWTEPERVMRWWGPDGFTTPVCTIDLRPGGVCHTCMRSPEGQDFWSKGVYREIVAPSLIVSTDSFADADGNVVDATHYGMSASWPREALITVTFAEHEGKTALTLRHAVGAAPATERDMCQQGWSQSLDRLAAYLATAK